MSDCLTFWKVYTHINRSVPVQAMLMALSMYSCLRTTPAALALASWSADAAAFFFIPTAGGNEVALLGPYRDNKGQGIPYLQRSLCILHEGKAGGLDKKSWSTSLCIKVIAQFVHVVCNSWRLENCTSLSIGYYCNMMAHSYTFLFMHLIEQTTWFWK